MARYPLIEGHHDVDPFDLPNGDLERIERELGVPMRAWFDSDQPTIWPVYRAVYAAGNGITTDEAAQLPGGYLLSHVVVGGADDGDDETANPT